MEGDPVGLDIPDGISPETRAIIIRTYRTIEESERLMAECRDGLSDIKARLDVLEERVAARNPPE